MASCCVCVCCNKSKKVVYFLPYCVTSVRAILNSLSLSWSGALRFDARFPFLWRSSLFSWSFWHTGSGWSINLTCIITRFCKNFAADFRLGYMIEGYYVEASKDFIHVFVVDTFPEALSCLVFVPIFCILHRSMIYVIFCMYLLAVLLVQSAFNIFLAILAHIFLDSWLSNWSCFSAHGWINNFSSSLLHLSWAFLLSAEDVGCEEGELDGGVELFSMNLGEDSGKD